MYQVVGFCFAPVEPHSRRGHTLRMDHIAANSFACGWTLRRFCGIFSFPYAALPLSLTAFEAYSGSAFMGSCVPRNTRARRAHAVGLYPCLFLIIRISR